MSLRGCLTIVCAMLTLTVGVAQAPVLLEAEIDVISLLDVDGFYTAVKVNRDTSIEMVLADTALVDSLMQVYTRQLEVVDPNIDGYPLYRTLLEPLEPLRRHLMVQRSGIFSDLPVETLMLQSPLGHESYKQHAYVIKDHTVTYLSSMDTWSTAVSNDVNGDGTVLITQGRTEKDAYLKEVKDIRDDFGGDLQYLEDADPSVRDLVAGARLLHFAVPTMEQDGGVRVGDRTYRSDAEMITLSALRGNASHLADRMIEAGAKALLAGPALSDSTARRRIATRYYRQLFDGDRKCDALQAAIKRYINDASTAEIAHPAYWAGWQLYGDIKSIDGNVPTRLYWILIIVMIALFILLRKAGGRLY